MSVKKKQKLITSIRWSAIGVFLFLVPLVFMISQTGSQNCQNCFIYGALAVFTLISCAVAGRVLDSISQNKKCISQNDNSISQNKKCISQNDNSISQNKKCVSQNDTGGR